MSRAGVPGWGWAPGWGGVLAGQGSQMIRVRARVGLSGSVTGLDRGQGDVSTGGGLLDLMKIKLGLLTGKDS